MQNPNIVYFFSDEIITYAQTPYWLIYLNVDVALQSTALKNQSATHIGSEKVNARMTISRGAF